MRCEMQQRASAVITRENNLRIAFQMFPKQLHVVQSDRVMRVFTKFTRLKKLVIVYRVESSNGIV